MFDFPRECDEEGVNHQSHLCGRENVGEGSLTDGDLWRENGALIFHPRSGDGCVRRVKVIALLQSMCDSYRRKRRTTGMSRLKSETYRYTIASQSAHS